MQYKFEVGQFVADNDGYCGEIHTCCSVEVYDAGYRDVPGYDLGRGVKIAERSGVRVVDPLERMSLKVGDYVKIENTSICGRVTEVYQAYYYTTISLEDYSFKVYGPQWKDVKKTEPPEIAVIDGQPHKKNAYGKFKRISVPDALQQVGNKEQFINELLAVNPLQVQVKTGQDIHKVFEKYRPGSCMRYDHCNKLRQVYANNPSKVCAVYLTKDHPLMESTGSCLVWHDGERNYIDRYYSAGYAHASMYKHIHAAIAKAITELNGKPCVYFFPPKDEEAYEETVTFVLDHNQHDPLPYIDSIKYIKSHTKNTVTLSTNSSRRIGECTSTDGTYPNGSGCETFVCSCCEQEVDEDNHTTNDNGDIYCHNCYSEQYIRCEDCREEVSRDETHYFELYQPNRTYCQDRDVCSCCADNYREVLTERSGTYYVHEDNATELHNGDYCHDSEAIELHNGEYTHASLEDCIELHNGEYALCEHTVELPDGEYALKDDCTELHDGTYALTEDAIELYDGQYALSDDVTLLHNLKYALTDDVVELSTHFDYNPTQFALFDECTLTPDGYVLTTDARFFAMC